MKVAIRADASVEIGTGHVIRCLALAEHLQAQGVAVRFLCRHLAGNLAERIRAQGHELVWIEANTWEDDARASMAALQDAAPWDWLVVDHYGLDARWEAAMRPVAHKILAIDDLANRPHDCDLMLDHNYYPDAEGRYDGLVPAHCLKLLGPRYALLRPQFARAREALRERTGEVRRILICFGGTDPQGATLKALEAIHLLDRPDIAVDVVIGGSNPHREEIEAACCALPQAELHQDVEDMASLMVVADLFVGSGGSITWERCCLGLPGVVLACAANQEAMSQALGQRGGQHYLGPSSQVTSQDLALAIRKMIDTSLERKRQREHCRSLVDGRGAERIHARLRR